MIDSSRNRVFHYAVLASLVLHGLVLFLFPDLLHSARHTARFPPPIVARLLEPEPVPAPVPPTQPVNEEQTPRMKPATPRISRPVPPPARRPARQALAPEPAAETLLQPAPPAEAPRAPLASVMETPAASAPPAVEAPESLSRDQYRLELIDEARRHKRYPPLARENNWQGDVRVAVVVGANGRASVTLKDSSGYEVLDRQALEMFTQATRAVPVPPALRGKELVLDVRAVYGLED